MLKRGLLKSNAPLLKVLLHFLDPLAIAAASLALSNGLGSGDDHGHRSLINLLAIYGPLFTLLIFPVFRMYRAWRGERLSSELASLLGAWFSVLLAINCFILLLADSNQRAILWPYGLFQEHIFYTWALTCLLAMGLTRLLARLGLRWLRKFGYNQRCAIIVGAGSVGRDLASRLEQYVWTGIKVSGFFTDNDAEFASQPASPPVLGKVADCLAYCASHQPDMVIITLPLREEETINRLTWQLGTSGIQVLMVPDLFAYGLQRAKLQQIGKVPVLAFNLFPAWKRTFDVIFSILALLALAPLFLLIALLIKISSRGPVFYSHQRIGETGNPFGCLKFRTMQVDADRKLQEILAADPAARAEWEKSYKLKDDPRVTKIGHLLRRTSLDELPQFLNVLRGEMSVVGARPIVNQELASFYRDTAITYCAMKPGITGPWQVGKRSDTENYQERVDLDCWYVMNTSVWLDLTIILKTVCRIFRGHGAY
ncbi:MAG: sugar transferase [Desulfobulbaceae bacterium]|nr:sugar transferase [Desulfobulbaceae bacterium]